MSKIAEQAVDQPEGHTEGEGDVILARENVAPKHELGRIGSPQITRSFRHRQSTPVSPAPWPALARRDELDSVRILPGPDQ